MSHGQAIYIGIGSNLGGDHGVSPVSNCVRAVEALRSLAGLNVVAVSRWYSSESIPAGAPDYVNGVARLQGDADPAWLLARLQAIEARAGRVRTTQDAPRPLDLDIVAIGATVRAAPDPILPHARAHLRRFVMQPLCDLSPDWVHPVLLQTAAEILAALPAQAIGAM